MRSLIQLLVERPLIVHLISIFLMGIGLFAIYDINREAFPNVNLDRVTINTVYPGASPEEIERLVITPIEQEIKSIDGIDKMNSISFAGSGMITLELDPDNSNRSQVTSDVQLAVDRASLPDDLPAEPVVTEINGRVFPVVQLAVSADVSELELKRLANKVEDDLLAIDGVARVQIQGDRKEEIRIVIRPDKLAYHRISIGEIAKVLEEWNINAPGGEIDTTEGQKVVRIVGQFRNADDAASLVLRSNERGDNVRLGDVADVYASLEKPKVYHDVAGKPALNVLVLKKSDADIIDVVDGVKQYIDGAAKRYNMDVRMDTFQDFSRFARLRLGVLTNNGIVGLFLVFISLVLFLRLSVAMSTTIGLPIVFLTGLYFLYISGITLNLISMFGFIMVLGMLVDDAIIIGENIAWHMEQGEKPLNAAVIGATELIGPVTTTILTTIAAFIPLMFMSGTIGKFIVAIPVVVISLLFFSWLESFLILPSHVSHLTRPKIKTKEKRWLVALEHNYAGILQWILKHRWLATFFSVLFLVASVMLAKTYMKFQLFPPVGVDQYLVRVTAPPGTSLQTMRNYLKQMDKFIRSKIDEQHLETSVLTSGQILKDDMDPLTQRGSRYGQIRAIYSPAVLRPDYDAMNDVRLLDKQLMTQFPQLDIAIEVIKPGPPTGRALEVEISGNDSPSIIGAANNLISFLQNVEGITSIESGLQPGDREVRVMVDKKLAAYAGVNLATVASHVRAAVDGLRVSTTRYAIEEVDVTIRYPQDANDIESLENLLIPNSRGGLVPLGKLARFEETDGYSTIRHKEGLRVVRVLANIDSTKITSLELNKRVMQKQSEWLASNEGRVNVNYGGEAEKNQESFTDLGRSFMFAMVAIFFLLAIQFNSMGYPVIVMLAIPFGVIGVIISFFLHDIFWKPMPLSFLSSMGMVALTGVVVNSSLILLVFVQRAVKDGVERMEAIVLAGRRRLRAVLLTATTTVVGLLPTAYGWGGMDPMVSPMALALSWGLAFATLITLVFIPAFLAVSMEVGDVLRKLWHAIDKRLPGHHMDD